MAHKIWTFFYGSFMHTNVVGRQGVALDGAEVATLPGFAIRMQPLSNVVPEEGGCVYGLVARLSHAELARLYAHLPDAAGDRAASANAVAPYLPEAVLVRTRAGAWRPALCYVAPPGEPRPAASAYLDRILEAARKHDFPEWYVRRLEETRARAGGSGHRTMVRPGSNIPDCEACDAIHGD